MFNPVVIMIGIAFGFTMFLCVLKNRIVIGRQYSYIDWIMVGALATLLFVVVMTLEWCVYTYVIWLRGNSAETSRLVFVLKKGCLVPFYSCGISYCCGWYIHKKNLDFAEGYSKWTAVCFLSVIVLSLCVNAQLILLPKIGELSVSTFIEDSIVAWGLMVAGSIFALGTGCEGRRNCIKLKRGTFQGYVWPILSAVIVGLLVGLAAAVPFLSLYGRLRLVLFQYSLCVY